MSNRAHKIWISTLTIGYMWLVSTILYDVMRGHPTIKAAEYTEPFTDIPTGEPTPSQEAVDLAIKMFRIQVPLLASHPTYDADMKPHIGVAYLLPFFRACISRVGPGAFTSWGMLGSTIAHEVEVHCNQNHWLSIIQMIRESITRDDQPTRTKLEREAYQYEIDSRERFHLTDYEVFSTLIIMETLYPKDRSADE